MASWYQVIFKQLMKQLRTEEIARSAEGKIKMLIGSAKEQVTTGNKNLRDSHDCLLAKLPSPSTG